MKIFLTESNPDTFVVCKECGVKMTQITHTHLKHKHNKMTLDQYVSKYKIHKKDLICKEVREIKKLTKENFIKKYGEIEGSYKWQEYCKKQSYSNTFEYKKNKHNWSEDDFIKFNKSRACTLENFIKRHGEIKGTQKWEEYRKKQSYVGCAEQYFIERYGQNEGRNKFLEVCKSKAITIENFIKKYGEYLGLEKWKRVVEKKLERIQQSRTANDLFDKILNQLPKKLHESIYYDRKNFEYFFTKKGVKLMFVDFYCSSNKKIIEFAGDYWHGNPEVFNGNFFVKQTNCTSKELYEKTLKRVNILEKEFNCEVLLIWENDLIKNYQNCIDKCINFILNDHKNF